MLDLAKYRDAELSREHCIAVARHDRVYVPLVASKLKLFAELDILLLTANRPGDILHRGGDLDNRLKTLLDGLTVPNEHQPPPPKLVLQAREINCLLEDDKLVTRISVENDQHLGLDPKQKHVLAVVNVTVRLGAGTMANLGLVS